MKNNQVVNPYALGLEVRKVSGAECLCVCPFHNDSAPSFSFNVEKGIGYCFACGTSATSESVAETLGGYLEMVPALSQQARRESIDLHWIKGQPLALGNPYLKGRCVSDEAVRRFKIRNVGGRAIGFELNNQRGELIGVQLRITDEKWLGAGLPKYMIYGDKPALWPFDHMAHEVRVVEGVFGVLNGFEQGYRAVCTMGAGIRAATIEALSGLHSLLVMFDNDYAGKFGSAKLVLSTDARVALPFIEADTEQWPAKPDTTRNALLIGQLTANPNLFNRHLREWKQRNPSYIKG